MLDLSVYPKPYLSFVTFLKATWLSPRRRLPRKQEVAGAFRSRGVETAKKKKLGLSHQHRLHVFNHTMCDFVPFRFYFNKNQCIMIHTQGQDSRTSRTTTSSIW
jgi:hypothetical protein